MNNFFEVSKEFQKIHKFGKVFNTVYTNFCIRFNKNKKQLNYSKDFLRLEFDIKKIKAHLLKNKPKKAIQEIAKLIEKKILLFYKKL